MSDKCLDMYRKCHKVSSKALLKNFMAVPQAGGLTQQLLEKIASGTSKKS